MVAGQPALGASQGRQARNQANVAGDSETARMGDALAVAHESVRDGPQFAEGGQQGGCLPEREQPGNVWEAEPAVCDMLFDDCLAKAIPYHYAGYTLLSISAESGIEPGHPSERAARRASADLGSQLPLDFYRPAGAHLPAVRSFGYLHFSGISVDPYMPGPEHPLE
jgi:hypothetical protein